MDSVATQVGGGSMKIHEIAQIVPAMSEDQYQELKVSIKESGLIHPIITYEDAILDGRHREQACRELGIEPRYVGYAGQDPAGYVVAANVNRRHLDESQRAMIAAKIATMRQGRPEKSPIGEISTQAKAAQTLNVGKRSVERARKVLDHGVKQLQQMVGKGEMKVSEAAAIAGLDEGAQQGILAVESKQERRQIVRQMRGCDSGVSAHENPKVHRWRMGLRRLQLFVTMREKEGGPASILDGISGEDRDRWASRLREIASEFQVWAQVLDPTHSEATPLAGDGPAAIELDGTSPGDRAAAPGSQQAGAPPVQVPADVGCADPPHAKRRFQTTSRASNKSGTKGVRQKPARRQRIRDVSH